MKNCAEYGILSCFQAKNQPVIISWMLAEDTKLDLESLLMAQAAARPLCLLTSISHGPKSHRYDTEDIVIEAWTRSGLCHRGEALSFSDPP